MLFEVEPTTAVSHGDPIIWTFSGECYDLNKDGLYLASSHPHIDHDVTIAVTQIDFNMTSHQIENKPQQINSFKIMSLIIFLLIDSYGGYLPRLSE